MVFTLIIVYNIPQMRSIITLTRRYFCDLNVKNGRFIKKLRRYQNQIYIHEKASKIDEKKMADFVVNTPKEKIAYQMANKTDYDTQLRDFIQKFNLKHKKRITLLDFSNYTTELGQLKEKPLRRQDIQLVKQFQKRKVDQKIQQITKRIKKKNDNIIHPEHQSIQNKLFNLRSQDVQQQEQVKSYEEDKQDQQEEIKIVDEATQDINQSFTQGPFEISDDFVIILLNVRSNTKVTTLNRINSYKTLLFMGNGNGIISYAKGRGVDPASSLDRALSTLKKNLIAIPRDSRCTLPLAITKRFQDYTLYLRPVPGFNSHGHPIIAFMLTLAGIDHCGFKVAHTEKNIYNVLKVFFKTITLNTTPQQLAQRQGFKVYRHQFIRPLTYVHTHAPLARKANVREYNDIPLKKKIDFSDFKQ